MKDFLKIAAVVLALGLAARGAWGVLTGAKAMARRTGANHGQMLYAADGYVTAWLLWHLQGDEAAARAFTGAAPELASNPLYQDVRLAC